MASLREPIGRHENEHSHYVSPVLAKSKLRQAQVYTQWQPEHRLSSRTVFPMDSAVLEMPVVYHV